MRGRTRFAIAVVAALALSVVAAGPAAAHTARTPTQLSMSYSWDEATGHFFMGSVGSTRPACEVGRSITLYRRLATGSEPVATRTNYEDRWWSFSMVEAEPGERYYAAAVRKIIRRPGHKHICLGDRSDTVTVTGPGGS